VGELILMEYRLRSFLPWPARISLDAIAGGDVFREPAPAVFTISKISFCTKTTIISSFSTLVFFYVNPAVHIESFVCNKMDKVLVLVRITIMQEVSLKRVE
jgi:hypothetical protein